MDDSLNTVQALEALADLEGGFEKDLARVEKSIGTETYPALIPSLELRQRALRQALALSADLRTLLLSDPVDQGALLGFLGGVPDLWPGPEPCPLGRMGVAQILETAGVLNERDMEEERTRSLKANAEDLRSYYANLVDSSGDSWLNGLHRTEQLLALLSALPAVPPAFPDLLVELERERKGEGTGFQYLVMLYRRFGALFVDRERSAG